MENENTQTYSKEKRDNFMEAVNAHLGDIKRCADIIYQLETDATLSLNDKDVLKVELGNKIDTVKSDSQDMLDALTTEYQLYDSTSPRITQDLSNFKMLGEKVVNKNKDYRVTKDEAENDNTFFFNE
ncbi:TPA: hypothetical protein SGW21_002248 [Staphylococcus aureus]|uniref:hypothetical protein n=1 Tax=Staphylococcus haemolyticus TaxID=1283 RepID=UPI0022A06F68|nr:hypothetical protein [Staphylococcus haemolyticus]HCV2365114.1 hypothetical protein [Staphylococcus aureus]MDO0971670.1 hypothetical protein [Staphylococcus haemolyticus]HCV6078108.1 hypothetical protein [Staphylococcus aureus]HDJ5786351.1 hypothetical protein [Staphylococcus aureus]HEH3546674.1 hypothetical protein [Staphylococcus aureus]